MACERLELDIISDSLCRDLQAGVATGTEGGKGKRKRGQKDAVSLDAGAPDAKKGRATAKANGAKAEVTSNSCTRWSQ